jgi:hypothetical protein
MPCLPVSGHVPEGQIARVKNRIDLLRRRD